MCKRTGILARTRKNNNVVNESAIPTETNCCTVYKGNSPLW